MCVARAVSQECIRILRKIAHDLIQRPGHRSAAGVARKIAAEVFDGISQRCGDFGMTQTFQHFSRPRKMPHIAAADGAADAPDRRPVFVALQRVQGEVGIL